VIGNPPYISLSKLKSIDYGQFDYKAYDKTGDILVLFFERSLHISNDSAVISLIVSNSWLKTKYGKALKSVFTNSEAFTYIINFEDTQIFDEATVETCIVTLDKNSDAEEKIITIKEFDSKNATPTILIDTIKSSTHSSAKDSKLMSKIEDKGKLLKEWDINISYGIKTGYNKAFIIDTEKKDELIYSDSKSEELIKPLIRGRDISKYQFAHDDKWIIVAKYNSHDYLENKYSIIYKYLYGYKDRLQQRGQCTNKGGLGQHHWLELDNNPTDIYLNNFQKEKIVWGEISDKPKFAYDDSGIYVEATSFMMTGEHLKYFVNIKFKLISMVF